MENFSNENKNQDYTKETEIDLMQLFKALLNKWIIILIVGIVCALVVFCYNKFFVTPQYTSSTQIMVINRQSENSITATDITSASSLSRDYVVIVTSSTVMDRVIADLNLDMTSAELSKKVTASIVSDTRQIRINVNDPDPIMAKQIADSVAKASGTRISEIMSVSNMVQVIDPGSLPTAPSSPNVTKYTLIAFVIGVIVTCVVIIIINIIDDKIKTSEDVEKYLNCSVLGIIPVFEGENSGKKKKSFFRKH